MSPTPTLPWSDVEQRLHSASSTRTPSSSGCSCWRSTTWDPWTWKEERAETADQMLDRLLEEMDAPDKHMGKEQGQDHQTQPKITDGRGKLEKVWWHWQCWGKWSPSAGCGGPGWSGRTNRPESAVAEEVARPVSLPPEEPPGLEVVRGNGSGGLLSGLTPGVNSLTLSGVPMTQTPVVARMSEGFHEPPVVGNREEGQGGKHQSSTEVSGGAAAVVETVALLERPGRSPVESPEDARVKQSVPAAPTGSLWSTSQQEHLWCIPQLVEHRVRK